MTSETLVTAITRMIERFSALARQDPTLQSDLRCLAEEVLAWTGPNEPAESPGFRSTKVEPVIAAAQSNDDIRLASLVRHR